MSLSVYVLTAEAYHDHSVVIGVASTLDLARTLASGHLEPRYECDEIVISRVEVDGGLVEFSERIPVPDPPRLKVIHRAAAVVDTALCGRACTLENIAFGDAVTCYACKEIAAGRVPLSFSTGDIDLVVGPTEFLGQQSAAPEPKRASRLLLPLPGFIRRTVLGR